MTAIDTPEESPRKSGRWARPILLVLMFAFLFFALAGVDVRVATYFRDSGIAARIARGWVASLLRLPGNSPLFFLFGTLLVLIFHPRHRRAALCVLLSCIAAGINWLIKWIASRSRPFKWGQAWAWEPFRGGLHGLFNQENLGFASGDTTQAFAWAEAMSIAFPSVRFFFYGWAVLTGFQRIASNAHYPTDVLAGAVLGVVTVRVLFRILWQVVPAPPRTSAIVGTGFERHRAELDIMTDPSLYFSLVIPCYNEEENVPTLLKRVEESLNTLGQPYEVILIDDGSTDSTPKLLADAQTTRSWLRILRMQKNSGQSAGFEAGFNAARGKFIGTIDADLQNDPEEVPRLVQMLDAAPEYDMVTGWRKDRQDTNFRRWQSKQANKIRNWISQDDIEDSASSLKVYRAHALKGLKLFNGAHRFFPALVKMRGYKVLETPVKHSPRFAGTAKYGFRNRAFRAFIDLLGVRWMKMRYLRYGVDEINANRS